MPSTHHTHALIEIDLDYPCIKTATGNQRFLTASSGLMFIEENDKNKLSLCENKAQMVAEIATLQIKELCEMDETTLLFTYKGLEKKYQEILKRLDKEDVQTEQGESSEKGNH